MNQYDIVVMVGCCLWSLIIHTYVVFFLIYSLVWHHCTWPVSWVAWTSLFSWFNIRHLLMKLLFGERLHFIWLPELTKLTSSESSWEMVLKLMLVQGYVYYSNIVLEWDNFNWVDTIWLLVQITLRIVGYHFSSWLIATLNLCLIYFKITWELAILLEHMHKKFETNQTKNKGGCQSERKVVTQNSKSDLPLTWLIASKRSLESP